MGFRTEGLIVVFQPALLRSEVCGGLQKRPLLSQELVVEKEVEIGNSWVVLIVDPTLKGALIASWGVDDGRVEQVQMQYYISRGAFDPGEVLTT